ncbi:MAG: hypothetical protein JXR07_09910 [Reichenbachiella sp.]
MNTLNQKLPVRQKRFSAILSLIIFDTKTIYGFHIFGILIVNALILKSGTFQWFILIPLNAIGATTFYFLSQIIVLRKWSNLLKFKLEEKNRRLASYSMNMIQKNELIDDLTMKLDSLKKYSYPSVIKELNGINKTLAESKRVDRDWKNFRVSFEAIHEGFISELRHIQPDLSTSEVKLCALLKLNLNLKETANVLGISPDSVKTARYRLKRKLLLGKEQSLTGFLNHIQDSIAA